ncbi:MAG TPA: trypsin-like peptidase domain-containing protein [Blastocatellia bacterium]|nr:trypsin-like peptidase domain-containing protein [Blastocatellia bacterium]
MSRLMFVYLSGSEKGKTRIYNQNRVTIGTSDACDLKLVAEEGGTLPAGQLAEVYDFDDGNFNLIPSNESGDLTININGEQMNGADPTTGYTLRDGDTVHFGHGLSSASVLFQVMPENFSTAQLARRSARQIEEVPAQPVHPLTATLFVKELTASLWAEIPRKVKLLALLFTTIIGILIIGPLLIFIIVFHRSTTDIEGIRDQMAKEQAERQRAQDIISQQQEELKTLREVGEQNRLFTQKIAERFSPGVGLVVGSYSFAERGTGRVLRYETADSANDTLIDQNGMLLASVDGAGPPVQIDYTGTGFVIENGIIATNKHVVRPWEYDRVAQIILEQGGGLRPQLTSLVVFFPSIQAPFALKEVKASPTYDMALCKFEPGDLALPVLPLSKEDPRSIIGEPVVLLGYPTGVDGLLQRIEDSEQQEIKRRNGESVQDIAAGLANRGLIRPLTTTGTISDARPNRVVHTAQTTEGGSGSPMFDRDGRVIGINSAILTTADGTQSFGGSNFGVPSRVTYEMLVEYHKGIPNQATVQQ